MWPTTYWNANNFAKQNCHLYFLRYADVLLMYAEACNELANGESDPLVDDALLNWNWSETVLVSPVMIPLYYLK